MDKATQKSQVLSFIRRHQVAIVSTVSPENKPEAATMGISEKDNLELIFQTPNTTRKYRNLKNNPNVAVTFGWDLNEFITVQYEGIVYELQEDEINEYRQIHITKNPISKPYAYLPTHKYFKIIPKWIRYWDIKKNKIFELTF
ncbi:pyridoxamine 5'-phosphate oxidase family protein [Candidatus Roizmanbacteria bacterium]|nr:pyridoxamine 5'-phosphate oxidase family protein [Candidatus Roizmanbacteria bacterium]